ncbi:CYFIP-related Rac1 interactor B-like isoform 2-T2 [Synchiropus picturatus]
MYSRCGSGPRGFPYLRSGVCSPWRCVQGPLIGSDLSEEPAPFIVNGAQSGVFRVQEAHHHVEEADRRSHLDHRGRPGDPDRERPDILAEAAPARDTAWSNRHLRMGNLIKVLTRDIDGCSGNFFLDFENAQPTAAESEVWEKVNRVLEESQVILEDLQNYRGAGEEIRQAIQRPGAVGVQERAWSAVVPLVNKLKTFYEFTHKLESSLWCLLDVLTSSEATPTQHLEQKQALARQFAQILHFTLRFDELKMTNPAIQNDFSYYRRTISRMRINNPSVDSAGEVNNELANRMSLFYAGATPMLKTLSDATIKFVSDNPDVPLENTTDCLSTMASVCKVMLESPEYSNRFNSEETVSLCLRVMVGVIILYDHVHPAGAFVKTSNIDMKGCIRVLREQPVSSVEGLVNALRYTTKHLNDEATPKHIRNMLH